jgi:WD40 repeat protein
VTPDGRYAVSGSDDGIKVWELSTGREVGSLTGHSYDVKAVAVMVGPLAYDGTKLWNPSTGCAVDSLAAYGERVNAVALTPDGRYAVISNSSYMQLTVWDLSTDRWVRTLAGHSRKVNAVAVTPDSRYAVSGSDDRTLKVWDLVTGLSPVTFHGEDPFHSVAIAFDGRTVIAGDQSGRVYFLSLEGLP